MVSLAFFPGKVLLAGEHAVVHGEPALAVSIDRGVRVRVQGRGEALKGSSQSILVEDKVGVVRKAIELLGVDLDSVDVEIDSDLPVGAGLGSSAAVAAAAIQALGRYLGRRFSKRELFDLVMECERLAHGNPSGVDPAAVIYRGLIWYVKGQPIERLRLGRHYRFLLVDSGRPVESTKEMVEGVEFRRQNLEFSKLLKKIGGVTKKLRVCLERGEGIGELVDENGRLLEELGVIGKRVLAMSKQLRGMGAAVKVTGAGGVRRGSGMLLVMHPDFKRLVEFVSGHGWTHFAVTIGE